jgi:hypothetical protein
MIKMDLESITKSIPKVYEWIEIQENNIISIGRDLTPNDLVKGACKRLKFFTF